MLLILLLPANSIAQGEVKQPDDSLKIKRILDEPVSYKAQDSIRLDVVSQKVYLYGKAEVKFGDIVLKSGYIEYDFKGKNVCAYPIKDSVGKDVDFPEFTDGKETFTAKLMCYNFESKKAFVEGSRAKQGEGFVHFDQVKVYPNKETHGAHGKYTTCDLEHPHYYFNISKAIVKPDNKIIAGPLMLYIADIPTPLALPFGFFPNQKNKGAGIIIPTYDNSVAFGSGLLNGGYYIPFGERFDLQITGSVYTRGTWGVRSILRYKNLYKNSGSFQLSYQKNVTGDKALQSLTNFSTSNVFAINWNHIQDPKAQPNSTFNANVNYNGSPRSDINARGTDFINNSYQSSISYRRVFPNTPFSLTLNASQSGTYTYSNNANRQSSNNLTFNLPDVNFAMNRIYPLKGIQNENNRNKKVIKELAKIYVTYNTQFRNTISFIDTALYDSTLDRNNYGKLLSDMRNGFQHNLSAGTSLKVLKKSVTINPSINVTERWYLQTLSQGYDPIADKVTRDTLRGPTNWSRAFNGSINVSATSKLYGMYRFSGFAKGKRESIIRHVLTPNLSFSYNPNFNSLIAADTINDSTFVPTYSPLQLGIYGYPPNSQSGLVSLNLTNSLEMKIKTKTDTGMVYKKVKLIDNFTVGSSYDLALDSFNMRDITIAGRTTLFKVISINGNMRFNPYFQNSDGAIRDKYLIAETGKLARFVNSSIAVSFSLSPETFKKKKEETENEETPPISQYDIPWNLSLNYNFSARRYFNTVSKNDTTQFIQTIGTSGSVSFTQNWRLGYTVNFDMTNQAISYTAMDVYRDLHCWEMKLSWVPFGPRQSYNFQINVKSAMLQDLKYNKRSQPREFR